LPVVVHLPGTTPARYGAERCQRRPVAAFAAYVSPPVFVLSAAARFSALTRSSQCQAAVRLTWWNRTSLPNQSRSRLHTAHVRATLALSPMALTRQTLPVFDAIVREPEPDRVLLPSGCAVLADRRRTRDGWQALLGHGSSGGEGPAEYRRQSALVIYQQLEDRADRLELSASIG
jgi:hypothetical protein